MRAVFVQAYTGPGDPVGVLRQYLARVDDPAAGEADRLRMTSLARAAFSRPTSRAQEKNAETALATFEAVSIGRMHEIEALARALAALDQSIANRSTGGSATALEHGQWAGESASAPRGQQAQDLAEGTPPVSPRASRRWRTRAVVLAVIGIALAAFVTAGIASGWLLPGDHGPDAQGVADSEGATVKGPVGTESSATGSAAGSATGGATSGAPGSATRSASEPAEASPSRWHVELASPWGDRPEPTTWFLGAQADTDRIPDAYDAVLSVSVPPIDRSTTRHVAAFASDDSVLDFWVARADDGQLCLIATVSPTASGAVSCVTLDVYRQGGIPLNSLPGPDGSMGALWNGKTIDLDPATAPQ
jgi:hypothetical protein